MAYSTNRVFAHSSLFRMKRCSNFSTLLLVGEKFHRNEVLCWLPHFDLYSSKCDISNSIGGRVSLFHLLGIDQFPNFFHLSCFKRRTNFISILERTNKFTIFFSYRNTQISFVFLHYNNIQQLLECTWSTMYGKKRKVTRLKITTNNKIKPVS